MGVKISELQEKTSTNDTDVLPIVDATGGTKKITVPNLLKTLTESISNIKEKVTNKGKWVKLAATTSTTTQTLTTESLSKFTAIVLQVTVSNDENRVLQSTTGSIDQFKTNTNWQVGFTSDPTNYFVNCSYVSDTSVNMRTNSQYDRGVLWGII